MKIQRVYLADDGSLDTVLVVHVMKKDGTILKEEVRFNDVERNIDGEITSDDWDRIESEAIEEVELRIQAYQEEAQEARNVRD